MKKRCTAFTLVELLVVIAIIALLLATLLPSLSETKQQTRRLMTSNNIRQLSICFSSYANDFNTYYPTPPPASTRSYYNTSQYAPHSGSFSRCHWGSTVATADRTIYNAAVNYGGIPATGHPSLGTPTWDKTAFTTPTLTGGSSSIAGGVPSQFRGFASPYALFFGFRSAYTPVAGNGQAWAGTPPRATDMTPLHNLVGDLITAKPQGGATGTSYLFTHAKSVDYRKVWNENQGGLTDTRIQSNLCDVQYRQDFVPTASLPSQMVGAYMGKADGSVLWYSTQTMVVALTSGQQSNENGIYWKLYGGGFAQGAVGNF